MSPTSLLSMTDITPLTKDRTILADIQSLSVNNNSNLRIQEDLGNLSEIHNHQPKKTFTLMTSTKISSSLQNLKIEPSYRCILHREIEWRRKCMVQIQVAQFQQQQGDLLRNKLHAIVQQTYGKLARSLQKKCQSVPAVAQTAHEQSITELKSFEKEIENMRQNTQSKLQDISFQGISQYQVKFRLKCTTIYNILLNFDKQVSSAYFRYNQKLVEMIQLFEQFIEAVQVPVCGTNELKCAENLYKSLCDLEECIRDYYKKCNLKTTEKKCNELILEEQKLQVSKGIIVSSAKQTIDHEANVRIIPTNGQAKTDEQFQNHEKCFQLHYANNHIYDYLTSERLKFHKQNKQLYLQKLEKAKILESDELMKKFRSDCHKAINIPVNAISAVNQQHIQDKYDKLYTFLVKQVSVARDYCILLMCKKFVSQGETTISSNPHAAFPLASVIVTLWKQIPDFGQLFLSHIFEESPFMVPYFTPQQKGQSNEEYAKLLGYRITDGQVEVQDKYLKRQAGIIRLYAAVMVTSGSRHSNPQHPFGIDQAWRWLTNFIQLTPIPEICETLIMEMLQTAGYDLWQAYGRQFVKLLFYIQQEYFPKLSAVDGGPKARLELQLCKFLREGQISKPQGLLPQDFW